MFFTERTRTPRDPNKFPATQLFLLALVRLAEPIALTSIFPYSWKLCLHFHVTSEQNAALFAGILIAAFSAAEACTGMYWGGLSDRLGRKPVLLFGCGGTLLSMLIVGFSKSYWVALFGRALGGLLNGNVGVIQTMVGELVQRPEHEPRAYAVLPFVWSIGTIIGPVIGGYFAEPADEYPNTFSPDGIFGTFPYLLPNVICALLLLLSMIAGYLFLDETHPDMQPWSTQADLANTHAETPLMATAGATSHAPADLRNESYGTFDAVSVQTREDWVVRKDGRPSSIASDGSAPAEKVFTTRIVMLIVSLGIFTYHSMTYDHLLPIFLQHDSVSDVSAFAAFSGELSGGLGLSVRQVGAIMSVNGLIALFVQAVVFPVMATCFGVWRLYLLVTIGHPIAYFIVPYLVLLPAASLYPAIYACLAVRNFFSIMAYPLVLILIKEASPGPSHLGKINGLAASTGAACRTIASPVAGLLYGFGTQLHFTPLAWWASALVALVGAMQVPFISRSTKKTSMVAPPAPCRFVPSERRGSLVRITIEAPPEDRRAEDEEAVVEV